MNEEPSIDELEKKLKSRNHMDRLYALCMLGSMKDEQERDQIKSLLLNALEDKDYRVICEAAKQLVKYDEIDILKILLDAVNNSKEKLRIEKLNVIGELGDKRAISPLIDMLEIESDTGLKRMIVVTLDTLGVNNFKEIIDKYLANARNAEIRFHHIKILYYYYEMFDNSSKCIDILKYIRKLVEMSNDYINLNSFIEFIEEKIEKEEDENVRKELRTIWFEFGNINPECSSFVNDSLSEQDKTKIIEVSDDFDTQDKFLLEIIDEIENRTLNEERYDEYVKRTSNNDEIRPFLKDHIAKRGRNEYKESVELEEDIAKNIAEKIEKFNSKFVYMELANKLRKYIEGFDFEYYIPEGSLTDYGRILCNYVKVFKYLDDPILFSLIIDLDFLGKQGYYEIAPVTKAALNQIDKETKFKNALALLIKGIKSRRNNFFSPFQQEKRYIEILTDKDAVDILVKTLKENVSDSLIWNQIIKILDAIGDNKSIEPLFEIFQKGNNFSSKADIARIIGKLGDERAVNFFIRTLKSNEESIPNREAAAGSLGVIGNKKASQPLLDTLVSLMDNSYRTTFRKDTIVDSLTKLCKEIPNHLLMLGLQDDSSSMRVACIRHIDELNIVQLKEQLYTLWVKVRDQARGRDYEKGPLLKALSRFQDKRINDYLITKIVDNPHKNVRNTIEFGYLLNYNDEGTIALLRKLAKGNGIKKRDLVNAIINTEGRNHGIVFIDLLLDNINENTTGRNAVKPAQDSAETVKKIIEHSSYEELEKTSVIYELFKNLKNTKEDIENIFELLKQQENKEEEETFSSYDKFDAKMTTMRNHYYINFLSKIKSEKITEKLLLLLEIDDICLKTKCMRTLGKRRDKEAVNKLISYLDTNESIENTFLRIEAIRALGEIGDKQAIKHLINHLEERNDRVRYFAIRTLILLAKNDELIINRAQEALEKEKPWNRESLERFLEQKKDD